MSHSRYRSGVEIPFNVRDEDIMQSLDMGHGYKWTVLIRQPVIIAHGAPTIGNMPELLITGDRTLIIEGGDPAYVERIRQVLAILQRHPNSQLRKLEGLNVG